MITDELEVQRRRAMTRWLLKTVAADGGAYGDFVWPLEVGAEVAAPDWSDAPKCGGGLHGLLDGRGDGGLLSWSRDAVWLVAEVPADAHLVDLGSKVKVDRCVVAHVGDQASAIGFLADQGVVDGVVGARVVAGTDGTATAGDYGTATAGDYGTATAGTDGTATAGTDGTATAGYRGTAIAGTDGTAIAGERGTVILAWWDDTLDRRRWVVGEVGIDGIKADTPYRCDAGRLEEAQS